MASGEQGSNIACIDADARLELVRNALRDRRAQLLTWCLEPMDPGASTSELYMLTGTARSRGVVMPWRFVVKIFNRDGQGWQQSSTDPSAWNYWKREWLVYQARWVHQLPGLVAPECFGAGELGESTAWLAIKDLSRINQRPWSLAQFGACARDLGAFNGRFVTDREPPRDEWLSRGWVRGWTELAEPTMAQLPLLADNPAVTRQFRPFEIDLLLKVRQHRYDLLHGLDVLQQSVAHNDVYPRNAFVDVDGTGASQTVAIDWASCGWAPLGADLAPLVGASPYFFEFDSEEADELERLCLDAYRAGLRETGWNIRSTDIYVGYLTTIVMRFVYGYAGLILTYILDDSLDALFEQLFDRPRAALLAKWREINAFGEARMTSLLRYFGYD